MTPEEYIALEDRTPYRSEFYDGAMLAMKDRTHANAVINGNLIGLIHPRLHDTPWEFFGSSMRVVIPALPLYTYPDASVVRSPARTAEYSDTTLIDPCLIVEVLSPSGESHERRANFQHFQKVETLLDYVKISQEHAFVEHYSRMGDTAPGRWLYTSYEGMNAALPLPSIGIKLALSDIYERVMFPAPGTTPSHKHLDHDRII